ncbi:tetratricopeptide repeat protein [Opitutus sp. ER46]|uniref:tetratricopeptide repeat protein n=1 Tax=Opitutus sp. ER46 TaxID=2161864 RepID=UPI000D301AF4|nr:tetratricopeptide repeat protein [Opitutus sp. ER46]PTY00681.1 hypothetical protein DB354_01080 [Opitutus sp. ER46]
MSASPRFRPTAPAYVALGAVLALILPVLIYGPWVPLIDLVAFVGMNSYPPQLSYGPVHTYSFQFTYVGHYALSRLLTDLHVAAPYQIATLYLLQAGACFLIVYRSLERLVENRWWRSVGIALGTLAFWDGVFIWGGPLAFSLGASCVGLATFLVLREAAEPERRSSLPIALLIGFGLICHPFALPFALILCGLRFLFVQRHRRQTLAFAGAVLLFGFVIVRDSPASEASATASLKILFTVDPAQMWLRVTNLFTMDALLVRTLFGATPWTSTVFFWVMGSLHLIGFAIAPVLAWRCRSSLWLRMLAVLNTVVGLCYLLSVDSPAAPIPEWPQRILTFHAPFTFLTAFAGLIHLLGRWRPAITAPDRRLPRGAWLVPAVLLLAVMAVQIPVLRFGPILAANVDRARTEFLQTNISSAYVVATGIDQVRPFYLRCVPFMLFSDPEIVGRHVLLATEWHFQDRHPSRITELAFNLGRDRYRADFSASDGSIHVQVFQHPPHRFPIIENTNLERWGNAHTLAKGQFNQGVTLLNSGFAAAALEHFNTAVYLAPTFGNAWNNGGAILSQLGRKAEAEAYFRAAVQAAPDEIDFRLNLATTLLENGRPAEATAELNEVLRRDPTSARARELLSRSSR